MFMYPPTRNIHRGTGLLVALNDNQNDATRLIDEKATQQLSFTKSSLSNQYYPGSIMGAMALLRQFFTMQTGMQKAEQKIKT